RGEDQVRRLTEALGALKQRAQVGGPLREHLHRLAQDELFSDLKGAPGREQSPLGLPARGLLSLKSRSAGASVVAHLHAAAHFDAAAPGDAAKLAAACSRSTNLVTLPVAFMGRAATKLMCRGTL